jgi:DNA repair photolyase
MGRAEVFPREARDILTRTGGYLRAFTHTLQPYVGCEFSCRYCYVREMTVQRANPYGRAWSHWISPKTNAPELLARRAKRAGLASHRIFCGSTTDPYTPLERRLRLTRGCLEVLVDHPPGAIVVQTRSPLVVRDADLLARLRSGIVSVTVATDDEAVRRTFEPNAPGTKLRIEALARLRRAGVRTQAALAPLLPCDPERLARWLEPVVTRVIVDDYFQGDGAGGARSRRSLALLRERGFGAWAEPGYAEHTLATFRRVLGSERVLVSRAGFNDLGFVPLEQSSSGVSSRAARGSSVRPRSP